MEQLEEFLAKIRERASAYIGYPASMDFDYTELYPLLRYNLNNVGDPFVESHFAMHTKSFEREVVQFFAELFHAPQKDWWGYVTAGGSESNLYGLYLAREMFPHGMVYYSEATHYSVQKNLHLLGMQSIVIRTTKSGEMDCDDFRETIQSHRHQPVIIMANIGTTMTEAKDDVVLIKDMLKKYAIKHYYIHCDAALAGPYLALLDKGHFDFRYGADSIAVSGHKFIGAPNPCGVVLVKKSNRDRISHAVSYIGSMDTTITGSRNAVTPVFIWYALKKLGREGLLRKAMESMELAAYAVDQLNRIGIRAWKNEWALTVVFPQASEEIRYKWQLASDGDWSHLICMPGVTRAQIDLFVADMKQEANAGRVGSLDRVYLS
ncbi:MAG: histidine decarboxylase [Williamsia sp.]|nr:histidine decarboxylase [Williamsia sp.]